MVNSYVDKLLPRRVKASKRQYSARFVPYAIATPSPRPMEFRSRDYISERKSHALPRSRALRHPLSAPYDRVVIVKEEREDFFDPLRGRELAEPEDVGDAGDGGGQPPSEDWNSFKRFLMQKFPVSRTISVSSMSDVIIKGSKVEKSSRSEHLGDLDDLQEALWKDDKVIMRQEYVSRLHELKDEINHAWLAEDRVTALKLSIKVSRLLMDTSVLQFYPTLFALATEVMDMLGEFVWRRIKLKAEFLDNGTFIGSLSESFRANDVCSDAKETCYNWFSKVGTIRELLPRIYLELAILPCRRFLSDQPVESFQRLVMMTRGIADPLASCYCRLYMVHCARKLPVIDIGYLVTCINDIKLLLTWHLSGNRNSHESSLENIMLLARLVEPTIEYIMKCIFESAYERQADSALLEIGLGMNQGDQFGNSPCVAIVLHHLLKELPSAVVSNNAVNILHLIKCSDDTSFDQCMNYRLLGLRILENRPKEEVLNVFFDEAVKLFAQYERLDLYLKVVDAYLEIVLQNHMDCHLKTLLDGVLKRADNKVINEEELENMQSILIKLLSCFKSLDSILTLSHFFGIFDMLYGSAQSVVSMHVLDMATRNGCLKDPTIIQLLFEISQLLYDGIDFAGTKYGDNHQSLHLITRFAQMVDYGADMERHLMFLVECRGAFGSINELKETLVHISNCLAIKALNEGRNNHSFIKSCVTFSEITIPSISNQVRQFSLYLETAEVSLLSGLVSYSDGLLLSAISCLENVDFMDGSPKAADVEGFLSLLQKLCSLLLMVPGDFDQGITKIPRRIISLICSQAWISPRMRTKMFSATILLLAALPQDNLPYHACLTDIKGYDRLFVGDLSHVNELVLLSEGVLQHLLNAIDQEPSKATRGSMALEACNCIASSFKVSQETSQICWKLIEIARSCLNANDKYLQSTIKYLDMHQPASKVVPPLGV